MLYDNVVVLLDDTVIHPSYSVVAWCKLSDLQAHSKQIICKFRKFTTVQLQSLVRHPSGIYQHILNSVVIIRMWFGSPTLSNLSLLASASCLSPSSGASLFFYFCGDVNFLLFFVNAARSCVPVPLTLARGRSPHQHLHLVS